MGLVSTLLKTAFAVTYPKKSAKLVKARWDMKHGYAPRISAVGVALVVLPIGYVIGRLSRQPRPYPVLRRDYNTMPETWE
jgi:hypothetical protein